MPYINTSRQFLVDMSLTTCALIAATTLAITTSQASADSTPTAQIHIDAAAEGTPVNSNVFGHFIKGADNYGIFSIPHPDIAVLHEGDGIWDSEARSPFPDTLNALKSYRPGILRFPGGLSVHNYDWKKTIGPVEDRGEWKFGLDEFMQVCAAVEAKPIIVVSEYVGTPQDSADLVEYLNMPAEDRYPWAMKRAANGHPEPYGVTYFEMGNESWVDWRKHEITQVRPPAEVGRYASEIAAAMKAVDPSIHCGVPFEAHNQEWTTAVLSNITDDIDFVVVHMYPVKYGGGDIEGDKEQTILEAMMAAGYTASRDLQEDEELIADITGRDLPMAITEYNMGPTQQQPNLKRPYRYSLASALGTGDFLGNIMNPEYQVCAAIYWNWLNGFFGAVDTYAGHPWKTREKRDTPLYRPNHYIFELWGRYRGATLLPIEIATETLDFPGYSRMKPALGKYGRFEEQLSEMNLMETSKPMQPQNDLVEAVAVEGGWDIHFKGLSGSDFSNLAVINLNSLPVDLRPPQAGLMYHVSYDAKWEPQSGNPSPTSAWVRRTCAAIAPADRPLPSAARKTALDWKSFESAYQPLADTHGIVVLSRLEASPEPVYGVLKIRNLEITPWLSEAYPARPALTAYATRSNDGKTLYLVVFNLTLDEDISATIRWDGLEAKAVSYSEINAPTTATIEFDQADSGWVVENQSLPLEAPNSFTHTFPAHSASGFVIQAKP